MDNKIIQRVPLFLSIIGIFSQFPFREMKVSSSIEIRDLWSTSNFLVELEFLILASSLAFMAIKMYANSVPFYG